MSMRRIFDGVLQYISQEYGENTKLWRYLTLEKYYDLLNTKALFFARPQYLGERFEGTHPKRESENNAINLEYHYQHLQRQVDAGLLNLRGGVRNDISSEEYKESAIRDMNRSGISCWHRNEYESNAMWKLYLNNQPGVAIQTNISKLVKAFSKPEPGIVWIGDVDYIDYRNDGWANIGGAMSPIFHKGIEFAYENEIRLLQRIESDLTIDRRTQAALFLKGKHYEFDVNNTIEKVVFSPGTTREYQEQIKDITEKTSGFEEYKFIFEASRLDDEPI